MTDHTDHRLWNFRQLVRAAHGNNGAAAILGVRPSYVTAIAGPNPNRTIGDRMAAKIERCFGLDPGALDSPPPEESKVRDPYIAEIVSTMTNTSDDDKEFVLAISQWIAARSTASKALSSKAGVINLTEIADKVNELPVSSIASSSRPLQNQAKNRMIKLRKGVNDAQGPKGTGG